MSVVVRGVGESHFTVFCKGSPEKIKSISLPETMPADFETTLDRYYWLGSEKRTSHFAIVGPSFVFLRFRFDMYIQWNAEILTSDNRTTPKSELFRVRLYTVNGSDFRRSGVSFFVRTKLDHYKYMYV